VLQRLAEVGVLQDYHSFNEGLLCSLDGTQYFSLTQVHCAQCIVIEKETGTRYAHMALIEKGNPRLCRGDLKSLTVPGVA
jgi:hypothetical protein